MKTDKLDLLSMQFLKVLPQLKSTNVADPSMIGGGLGERFKLGS